MSFVKNLAGQAATYLVLKGIDVAADFVTAAIKRRQVKDVSAKKPNTRARKSRA